MSAIMTGCFLAFVVIIALWRREPVLFMLAGGVTLISACYMPDILTGGVTTNLSLTASLVMFCLWLICWAYAFALMFRGASYEGNE